MTQQQVNDLHKITDTDLFICLFIYFYYNLFILNHKDPYITQTQNAQKTQQNTAGM